MGRWTAACGCGGTTVVIDGEPVFVNACACLDCQRGTGSSFSYTAFFRESDVGIDGPVTTWETASDASNRMEAAFCPVCGFDIHVRLSTVPGKLGIPVGLLTDPDFPAPNQFLWAKRKHNWVHIDPSIEIKQTQ